MARRRRAAEARFELGPILGVGMLLAGGAFVLWRFLTPSVAYGEELPPADPVEYPLTARLSAYWPATTAEEEKLEGGPNDVHDRPLYSLGQYLSGAAPYVSVAADRSEFTKYGEQIAIQELEQRYERPIVFRVVDALHADRSKVGQGTGTGRLDIRVDSRAEGLAPELNQLVHYRRIDPPADAKLRDSDQEVA